MMKDTIIFIEILLLKTTNCHILLIILDNLYFLSKKRRMKNIICTLLVNLIVSFDKNIIYI